MGLSVSIGQLKVGLRPRILSVSSGQLKEGLRSAAGEALCPRSLSVSIGQLKEGLRSAAGYIFADKELKQQADPCGTLTLKQYRQEASLAESASLAADWLGICRRSLIVSTGQLEVGLCSATGYTAADEKFTQQAVPCGTLTLQQYKQEASLAECASLAAALTRSSLSMLPALSSRRAACTIAGSMAIVPTHTFQIA